MTPPNEDEPRIGMVLYVSGALFLAHGQDDRAGGKATVTQIERRTSGGQSTWFVSFEEVRGSFNYTSLLERQAQLRAEYGDAWAHPDPDEG